MYMHTDPATGRTDEFVSDHISLPTNDPSIEVNVLWWAKMQDDEWRSGYTVDKLQNGRSYSQDFDLPSAAHVWWATRGDVDWSEHERLIPMLEKMPTRTAQQAPEFQPVRRVA